MTARSFPRPHFLNIMIVDWFRNGTCAAGQEVSPAPSDRLVANPPSSLGFPRPSRERGDDPGRSKEPQPEKGAG